VGGQSTGGARIEDGDLLVVEEDEDPPNGAVVVALLGNGEEVTVKGLFREGAYLRFSPQNGDHEDLLVPAGKVTLQGRVVHPPRRRGLR
jgi:repressor LexA